MTCDCVTVTYIYQFGPMTYDIMLTLTLSLKLENKIKIKIIKSIICNFDKLTLCLTIIT